MPTATSPSTRIVADDFDYSTNGGRITVTSAPRPQNFTWGEVVTTHVIGDDYQIVEYIPAQAGNESDEDYDPSPQFSVFVRGARGTSWDTGHSYSTLDTAVIAAIAWRAEMRTSGANGAANSQAVHYISEMLGLSS